MIYSYQDYRLSAEERAKDLLSLMTVREKVGQLNQHLYGFRIYERDGENINLTKEFKDEVKHFGGLGVLYGLYRADPWSGRTYENGLVGSLAPRAYNMVQKYCLEQSRLGIPMLLTSECPHGHQALDGYILPVNLGVGATFNSELLQKAYKVCGSQLKSMGVNMALISVLDVLRDPRWGRSEECYSEDPYLCGVMAGAAVMGIQANNIAAVAKHFCAQGEGTGGINASAARIGERELREIHLPVTKACITAGVKGIMAAYNEIDGVPCHSNQRLLTDMLRDEMRFDGVIMADGLAIDRLDIMTGDNISSGALALKAGIDISLWDEGFTNLEEALDLEFISTEDLDKAVFRVLKLKFELGLFEKPYIDEADASPSYTYDKNPEALQLARESICLLKNKDKILPLNAQKIHSLAVIGPNADEIYNQLGDYTPPVREGEGTTVLQGIREYVNNQSESIKIKYSKGCGLIDKSEDYIKEAVGIAKDCDYTILVLGGSSSRFMGTEFDTNGAAKHKGRLYMDCGEGVDVADLRLPGLQNRLAKELQNEGCKVITIVIQGRPYVLSEAEKCSDALLSAFYPGLLGGVAVAEILFGTVCPSGHLPVSFPRHSGQLPVYYNYKSSYEAMNYYDTSSMPMYSFGYGLSYTKFDYSGIQVNTDVPLDNSFISSASLKYQTRGSIQITLRIHNEGEYDSYALILLFTKRLNANVIPRVKELKAFKKVWLNKGESKVIDIYLDEERLSYWNDKMEFKMEPGKVQLILSDGSQSIWEGIARVVEK
jgi:beta-glucosidase